MKGGNYNNQVFKQLQEVMKKCGHLYGFYLVDYVPPVDETVLHKLVKISK